MILILHYLLRNKTVQKAVNKNITIKLRILLIFPINTKNAYPNDIIYLKKVQQTSVIFCSTVKSFRKQVFNKCTANLFLSWCFKVKIKNIIFVHGKYFLIEAFKQLTKIKTESKQPVIVSLFAELVKLLDLRASHKKLIIKQYYKCKTLKSKTNIIDLKDSFLILLSYTCQRCRMEKIN